MESDAERPDLLSHPFTRSLVRRMSLRLCDRPGRTRQDAEEIAQEISLHLWGCSHLFDPERGSLQVFVTVKARGWARMDFRRSQRPKRAGQARTVSLDAPGDSDGTPLWSVLTEADGLRRLGRCASPVGEALQRDDEIDGLLRNLPEKSRELVREVMAHGVEEVAKRRGVTPGRVRSMLSEARKDIRISRALSGEVA